MDEKIRLDHAQVIAKEDAPLITQWIEREIERWYARNEGKDVVAVIQVQGHEDQESQEHGPCDDSEREQGSVDLPVSQRGDDEAFRRCRRGGEGA
ncbi:hypothetical protein [Alicyclobacillus dauci]|uniref:Uncharacterized protein n=1 Tax=Alicyclobacillus dauci TaxID=1475485 RepID=A0ABY6Z2P0_9BACL|nr:hypothetical protein [Alicyclobacillus dauci]WAH36554.1 hypothetical protein NZD86_20475 [Alicyclobacillus dauci]